MLNEPPNTGQLVAYPDEPPVTNMMLSEQLLRGAAQLVIIGEPKDQMHALAQRIVEVVSSADAALVWVYQRQHGALRVESFALGDMDVDPLVLSQMLLRPGEGWPGVVLQHPKPHLIEGRVRYRDMAGNVSQRNQLMMRQFLDALPRERDVTSVLLPIRLELEPLGVLELFNFGQMPAFQEADLDALETFATLVGCGITRIHLREQMRTDQRRLEVFGAISTAVSTAADLDELMGNVLDVILEVTDSTVGALQLYNPATAVLTIGAERGIPQEYLNRYREVSVADSACEDAVRYGQLISRPLIADSEEDALINIGLKSCFYLPLLAGGTVTGVVGIYGETALYDLVDVQALMLMGNLVGFAIANVTLYQVSDIERRRLHAVINGIAEGVALCDGQGRLVLANQTAMALLSVESWPQQQPLSDMPDFFAIRDVDGTPLPVERLPFARALSGEVFHDYRVLVRGASGGDTVMSFSGAPVSRDDAQTTEGAVIVFRDVTASQKIERAKDDFLAVAAHELRSPLAAVRSYTDLLVRREQRKGDEDTSELRGLNTLAQQVSHMLQMVDNLLDVSRLDADQFNLQVQRVDLVALTEQVLQQQRPSAGERTLLLETDHQELFARCDQLRIRQVLTNLVSNAVRYSPPQSQVRVSLTLKIIGQVAARYPHFASARPADAAPLSNDLAVVLLAVEDQGAGISEEQRGRLFRRYARGRERRGEGLGLGLYLSREFIVRHGGAIWAESHAGSGSTFFVALPLETGDVSADPAAAAVFLRLLTEV